LNAERKIKLGRPQGANRAEETRAKILNAAQQCFANSGYSGTSNKQVASLSGVTTGTLYHHFENKADIYAATLRHVIEQIITNYQAGFETGSNVIEKIEHGLANIWGQSESQLNAFRFAMQARMEIQRDAELATNLSDGDQFAPFFLMLLEDANNNGELIEGLDLEAVALALAACLAGLPQLNPEAELSEYKKALGVFAYILK